MGLITTLLALMSAAWILMTLEVAVVASLGISWAIYVIVRQAMRIHEKFGLSNEESTSFADIMKSPVVPSVHGGGAGGSSSLGDADDDDGESASLISNVRKGAYEL